MHIHINDLNIIFGFQVNMENLLMPSEICVQLVQLEKEKQGKKISTYPCFRGLTFF